MRYYEVQHYTLADGWVNTWTVWSKTGRSYPMRFRSRKLAESELEDFWTNEAESVALGDCEPYSRDDFRIVSVNIITKPKR